MKHRLMILDRSRETNERVKSFLEEDFTVFQAFSEEEAFVILDAMGGWLDAVLMEEAYWLEEKEPFRRIRERVLKNGLPSLSIMDRYSSRQADQVLKNGARDILIKNCEKFLMRKRVENLILQGELASARECDPLTGLYNKDSFFQRVERLLGKHPRTEYSILCLDIERFKVVNVLYGTQEGDRLLSFVGEKLRLLAIERGGVVGRLVSDIFVGCFPNETNDCEQISKEIADVLHNYPLQMEILAALGFYRIGDGAVPVSTMCERALIALNSIKGNYLKDYAIYDDVMRSYLIQEQELLNDMETALENREFKLYLQPQCNMNSSKIVGAEALVRWEHRGRGMLFPDQFIPLFEENHFILKLDVYMWRECCRLIREWVDSGKVPIPISVNLSRIHLCDSGLYETLVALVEKYRISPAWINLEVTESAYVDDTGYLNRIVDKLRNYGFTILLDDFGHGYSSLSALKDIRADVIKLDMRFLTKGSDQKKRGSDILTSVICLAKRLSTPVLIEGVETKDEVEFLRKINCHYAQGFYYYKPMTKESFQRLFDNKELVDYNGIH